MASLDGIRLTEPPPPRRLPGVSIATPETDRRTAERLPAIEDDEGTAAQATAAKDPAPTEVPVQTPVSGTEAWIRGLTLPQGLPKPILEAAMVSPVPSVERPMAGSDGIALAESQAEGSPPVALASPPQPDRRAPEWGPEVDGSIAHAAGAGDTISVEGPIPTPALAGETGIRRSALPEGPALRVMERAAFPAALPTDRPPGRGGVDAIPLAEPSPAAEAPLAARVSAPETDRLAAVRMPAAGPDEGRAVHAAAAEGPTPVEDPAPIPVSGAETWIRGLVLPQASPTRITDEVVVPATRPVDRLPGGFGGGRLAELPGTTPQPTAQVALRETDWQAPERLPATGDGEDRGASPAAAGDSVAAEDPISVSRAETSLRGSILPEDATAGATGASGMPVSVAVAAAVIVVPAAVSGLPTATVVASAKADARTEGRPSGEILVGARTEMPPTIVAKDPVLVFEITDSAAVSDAEPESVMLQAPPHAPARMDPVSVASGDSLPRAQPVQQVADAVLRAADGATELTLVPEELGPVRIDLSTDHDQVVLTVSAERPETLDLLRRSAAQLAAEMRAIGFLQVDLSFGQWSEQGPRGDRPVFIAVADEAAPAVSAVTMRSLPGASLFLRI
ncbi:MAG: flagellar hook-length control protein FliK [Rhodobacteraceae bacterium]|nr:flagellar hook-length control protein FliK [Paracoccaceae bacterium]